jgi:hypothetical protein
MVRIHFYGTLRGLVSQNHAIIVQRLGNIIFGWDNWI